MMVSLERERKLQGCFRCLVGCLDEKVSMLERAGGVFVIHHNEWIKWIRSHCNVRDDAELNFQDALGLEECHPNSEDYMVDANAR